MTVISAPGFITVAVPMSRVWSPSGTSPLVLYRARFSSRSTGSSSRIAAASRPLASAGVAGASTFRPGTWAYQTSRFCECVAASCCPPPPGVRITSGTLTCPPNIERIFAAWLTIWSMASRLKLIVMISTTGRSPSMAAPIAVPTNPSSQIGVSRTRRGPNSVSNPAVIL
ncbi:hypothetical protein ATK30_0874 [Amycolatopsis echigonensis]|uniref:Uncharacterized protein n=1 Tax=Amycolatopsis echigonensis TaxID=2576905 RepID=A0A2N3X189_9PSEU|nr:hypothetical protein ATK30_0874 [Amycolatopsis niigatensis]